MKATVVGMEGQLVDNERDDTAAWDELLSEVGMYVELLLILNRRRDKEVWQYIVGVASHLEYLAVAILWVTAGSFDDYEDRLTLGVVISKIESKHMLDPALSRWFAPSTDSATRLLIGERYPV